MESLGSDIFSVLKYLLPGFVTAWIFHALTSHPKQNQFERVVQALIFTLFIQCATSVTEYFLLFIGKWQSIGKWNETSQLFWSVFFSITIGFTLVYYTNNNRFHDFLAQKGITKQTSYFCEWSDIFNTVTWFVIVDLKNGRRVFGWPSVWPSDPNKGHIVLQNPEWIDNGKYIKLDSAEFLVINVNDIEYVEFLKDFEEN
ncbi:DUF6338 family protein [Yersinia ruckeri]|uniref:DUF6338 family protein n=1 Tax=Yersinia ruckeri TaxID=29486 RepID=UPI002237D05F|nr:DUF6338 family protein [Yersinia ruckeri]MCW6608456.1 DUF6338 family protein [Yersinia ruckeri]MCW6615009.1 DUF6338 family protein [Yersinia ruckeri]